MSKHITLNRILLVIVELGFLWLLLTPDAHSQTTLPPCTVSQHASYTGWHPQVDQRFHCVYDHEHGSDPGLALPSIGSPYATSAADAHMGVVASIGGFSENHQGFKFFVFNDRSGHIWRMVVHMGSFSPGRVCNRYHEVQVAIWDASTWEKLLDVKFMGDFGASTSNRPAVPGGPLIVLTPSACPNQGSEAASDGSHGTRQFGVYSLGEVPYQPWRIDDHKLVIPLDIHSMTFWTDSPGNDCKDTTCDVLVQNYASDGSMAVGASRFVQYYSGTGIRSTSAISGTFYTDVLGRHLLSGSDPGAIEQYVKPGSSFSLPAPSGKCFQWGVGALYSCGGYGQGWPFANYGGLVSPGN
jgi:hypothetical protein